MEKRASSIISVNPIIKEDKKGRQAKAKSLKFAKNVNIVEEHLKIAIQAESQNSSKLKAELDALTTQHKLLQKEKKKMDKAMKKLQKDNEHLKNLLSNTSESTKSFWNEMDQLKELNAHLHKKLKSKKKDLTSVTSDFNTFKTENQKQITKLHEQLNKTLEERNSFEKKMLSIAISESRSKFYY